MTNPTTKPDRTPEERLEDLERDFELMRRSMVSFMDTIGRDFEGWTKKTEVEQSLTLLSLGDLAAREARFLRTFKRDFASVKGKTRVVDYRSEKP